MNPYRTMPSPTPPGDGLLDRVIEAFRRAGLVFCLGCTIFGVAVGHCLSTSDELARSRATSRALFEQLREQDRKLDEQRAELMEARQKAEAEAARRAAEPPPGPRPCSGFDFSFSFK